MLLALILVRKHITPLIRSIRKVRFRGVEVELEEKLDKLRQEVEEAPGQDIAPALLPDKYIELASISTRSLILESWKDLEISIIEAAASMGLKSAKGRPLEDLAREVETQAGLERKVPLSNLVARMRRVKNSETHDLESEVPAAIALEMADVSIQMAQEYRAISGSAD